MKPRAVAAPTVVWVLLAAACATSSAPVAIDGLEASTTAEPTTTSASEGTVPSDTTTTLAPAPPPLDVLSEARAWEDVTISTEDGLELYARFWSGGPTAVLSGHDFDNAFVDRGTIPPQSSEIVLPFNGALARDGFTVLSFDFRGHGLSEGEKDIDNSPLDVAAAYSFLEERGYETIVAAGWASSGTVAIVTDVERDDVAFDGVAMLFAPPQEQGMDADAQLDAYDVPVWFVGSNAGRSASWSRRMAQKAADSRGVFVFENTLSGLQFIDVFGGELAGRMAAFFNSLDES